MNKAVEQDHTFFQVDRSILNRIHPLVQYPQNVDPDTNSHEVNMVIIGHVDAGKSTLMGHLLHKLGLIGEHTIRKNEKITEMYKKATFEFAYIMDEDEEEREHGVTINTAMHHF